MAGTKIKKNDLVKIIAGKNKGATGKVLQINGGKNKIIVEGLNLVSKTVKKRSAQEKGGIISIEAPMDISNVQLVSKGNVSRIGYKIDSGKKVRVVKKTGDVL